MRICENGIYRDMTEEEIAEHGKSPADKLAIAEVIEAMKQDLASSDYKVIKCIECYLLGKEMPYDVDALHAERQSKRDAINKQTELLKEGEEPKWY